MEKNNIDSALVQAQTKWMELEGVTGVGLSKVKDSLCIKVYTAEIDSQVRATIPAMFQGFPVVVEDSGEINALDP